VLKRPTIANLQTVRQNTMKKAIIIFLLFLATDSFGQREYKNYSIRWDTTSNMNFLFDTLTKKKIMIESDRFPGAHRFEHGFVYVRYGDMRGLMDLSGRKLLPACHFIRFNDKDSLISAYVCSPPSWIFLNYKGDTLSYGNGTPMNYCPQLDSTLTAAYTMSPDRLNILWGYLDKKAKWKIKPQFQVARNFKNGIAKVKLNDKWAAIDTTGNFLVMPKHDTEEFDLE
jgi:hypothetical protein